MREMPVITADQGSEPACIYRRPGLGPIPALPQPVFTSVACEVQDSLSAGVGLSGGRLPSPYDGVSSSVSMSGALTNILELTVPDLVSWWKLEEPAMAPRTRADSVGTNDLSDYSSDIPRVTGKVGYGIGAGATCFSKLYHAPNSDLAMTTGNPFTLHTWLKVNDSVGNMRAVITKGTEYATLEYGLCWDGAQSKLVWVLSKGATYPLELASTGTVSLSEWHHVCVGYDPSAPEGQEGWMQIDNGTRQTGSCPWVGGGSANFALTNFSVYSCDGFPGYLDEVGIWKRSLTLAEVAALYNSGAGTTYPFS